MIRIGILGGTFDPPHVAHLILASDVCERLELERMLFVPAASPPHKREAVRATPEQRMEMVHAAIAGDPRFEADDIELRREGPSYSVETLRVLRERFPDTELFFVIGSDQLRELDTWHEPDEVAHLARIVVVERAGEPLPESRYAVVPVPITRVDVSSTEIRRRIEAGVSVRYLVPVAVGEVIERYGLYK